MSVWPYSTRRWGRLRLLKLHTHPLCEACLQMGEVEPANVVDHRTPISKRGRKERSAAEAFPALDKLASSVRAPPQCEDRRRATRRKLHA